MTSLESSAILRELAVLNAHVSGLALELAEVRTTLDIQFKRIAALQAEVDLLPAARRRRDLVRAPAPVPPGNGNGRSHR
jgi:uncharacterized small protein (DUF1192 family)